MSTENALAVDRDELALAVAAFPDWLADDVANWIRVAEDRGTRFPSAFNAVQQAVASLCYGAEA